jgi:hypothetical protein
MAPRVNQHVLYAHLANLAIWGLGMQAKCAHLQCKCLWSSSSCQNFVAHLPHPKLSNKSCGGCLYTIRVARQDPK